MKEFRLLWNSFLIATVLAVCTVDANTCIGGSTLGLDLTKLYWSEGSYQNTNDNVTFNLCEDSASTCSIKLNNGTVIGSTFWEKSDTQLGETLLKFNSSNGYQTFLYFSCDMNSLGVPVWLDTIQKQYFFEWKSVIACTSVNGKVLPQMPCYIYTTSHDLIDLSGLTKAEGYHNAAQDGCSNELRINVCANVATEGCDGVACSKTGSEAVKQVSKLLPATKLELKDNVVQLKYPGADGTDGRETLIKFFCPASPRQARHPEITSSCSPTGSNPWTIDWYTTHACPSSHLVAAKSCKLANPKYGVDMDLSPLSNGGKTFTVDVDPYRFEMGLCGTKVDGCPLPSSNHSRGDPVACQKKPTDSTYHKNAGMSEFTELKYIDGTLVMKLYKGEKCGNNVQRSTVIYFYCNVTAGIGHPVYNYESHCTYYFNWNTSYACDQSSPCTYQPDPSDSSLVYDFSSLKVHDGSPSWTTKTNETAMAYINVCHAVGEVDGCDPTSAVCLKNVGRAKGVNLGSASSMEFGRSGNTISLTYTNGDECEEGKHQQTAIYFMCDEGSQLTGPQWNEDLSEPCKNAFFWYTSVACKNSSSPSADCKVTSNGYTYDFSSIKPLGDTVKFNPCSALPEKCGTDTDATVCQGDKTLSKKVPNLEVVNDQVIRTQYEAVDGGKTVMVRYNCYHLSEEANVTSTTTIGNSINIEVNTTLSCPPKEIDCRPTDSNGNTYDLSGLAGRNYKAERDGMKYYFSICSPLDKTQDETKKCPVGAMSACQNTTDGKFVNIGYAATNPEVLTTGTIHFHYINGKPCGHGNKTPRQTTIILNCVDIESEPVVHAEDGNCNYEISWDTPKACPVTAAKSIDCGVIRNGIKYDLSSLTNTRTAHDTGGNIYYMSVCTDLNVNPPLGDACKSAGVCLKESSTYSSAGQADTRTIDADSGNVEITYSNGKDGMKSIITFLCAGKGENELVSFVRTDDSAKVNYFQWKTKLVCEPVEVDCTRTIANGSVFDLTSLVKHDSNYIGHTYNEDMFYINICHRLIANGDAENCPAGAAACMATGSGDSKKYVSLGRMNTSEPVVSSIGGAVHILYNNGEKCHSDPSLNYSSLIMFKCNPDREVVGGLEVARFTDCRQDFIIETSAACALPALSTTTTSPPVVETCGQIEGLDTDALKKQYKIEADDHTYYLNFCTQPRDGDEMKTCNNEETFGVCQVSKDSNREQVIAGLPSGSGEVIDHGVMFNYTGGATCMHDPARSHRNVLLNIHCNQEAPGDSEPVFGREAPADCTYYFYWARPELCTTDKVSCTVSYGGHLIDLSSLSDETHFAHALSELGQDYVGKLYQLSVCKPLPLTAVNRCPGAAVCETDNSDLEIYKDLGFVSQGLKVVGTGDDARIQLVYNTSTPCDLQPGLTISSVIIFSCGGHVGAPELVNADGCTYTFSWQTSEACHDSDVLQPSTDCKIRHVESDTVIDLSTFKGHTYQNSGYKVRICENIPSSELDGCPANSAVCDDKKNSGGKSSTAQLTKHGKNIILQYSSGSSCRSSGGSGHIVTMIEFVCDPSAGKGEPNLQLSFDGCMVQFQWRSSYVCVPDCIYYYLGKQFDFRHLTSHSTPYEVVGGGYNFTLNICKDLPVETSGTEATCISAVKDGKKHSIALTYSLVPHYWDNKTLALTYYGPDSSICSDSSMKPAVLFTLTCANTLGQPTFVREVSENCTFMFKWSTYVACSDDVRTAVDVVDGQFVDPVSLITYSVHSLWNQRVDVPVEEYNYAFSLSQPLPEEANLNPKCTDGQTLVCQYKTSPHFTRAIGGQNRTYYYADEELQVVLESSSVCGRDLKSNVKTIINFICNDKSSNDSKPVFKDETHTCRYLFEWPTPDICQPMSSGSPNSNNSNNKLSSAAVAAIVVSVLLVVALIIGVVVYKLKRKRRWDGVYEYTGISADDDTTSLVSANRGSAPRFYDDDDEELII